MKYRAGVTTNPSKRRVELQKAFEGVRKWETTSAFPNKASAEIWMKRFSERYECSAAPDGSESAEPGVKWYGFSFEHD